jgi:hypothetical protein
MVLFLEPTNVALGISFSMSMAMNLYEHNQHIHVQHLPRFQPDRMHHLGRLEQNIWKFDEFLDSFGFVPREDIFDRLPNGIFQCHLACTTPLGMLIIQ